MKRALSAALAAVLVLAHLQLSAESRLRLVGAAYSDEKGGGLRRPEALDCDGSSHVVVGDTGNDRLLRFTYQDGKLTGGREIKTPELSAPVRVRLGTKGDIYALDGTRRRIVHLAAEGEFKAVVALDASTASAAIVKSFTTDRADNLYVLDAFSGRVLVLDPAGQLQRTLPLPKDAGFVSDLSVDGSGTVLALDSIKRRVYAAAKDATSFAALGGDLTGSLITLPTSITASRGVFLVAEGLGGNIASFGRDGTFVSRQLAWGWKEGALNHPAQICVTDTDEVFVADRDNSRIQVFTLTR